MGFVFLIDEEIREVAIQRISLSSQNEVRYLGFCHLVKITNSWRYTSGTHVDQYAAALSAAL